MANTYTVTLQDIIKETSLQAEYLPKKPEEILISSNDLNRPGLQLAGYYDYFYSDRIQILGRTEVGYLNSLDKELLAERIERFVSSRPPAIILCRNLEIIPELRECCVKYEVPLLKTQEPTSSFMAALIAFLNVQLAPRITRHGVFVEVYGEGILLIGTAELAKAKLRLS